MAQGNSSDTEKIKHHPSAVVIGNHTQGLGIVRSAGAGKWNTWVVNDKALSLARFSKYLSGFRKVHRGTLSRLDDVSYADHLVAELLKLPIENSSLIFGVHDDITRFVFQNREKLSPKYFIPDVRLDQIYDKFIFNTILPDSARIETRLCSDSAYAQVDDPAQYIIKGRQGNGFRMLTGLKAMPLAQFTEKGQARIFDHFPPDQAICQRIVISDRPVASFCSFCVEGKVHSSFQYEKLRQHPDQFGTGTYLRSAFLEALPPIATQVLERLNYTGISEIEFIHDPAANSYKVIEMNPRTWKSIHFATQCGPNLVNSYLTYIASGQSPPAEDFVRGRHWVDLATDIPQMIREKRISRFDRDCRECTWDFMDPLPGLALWGLSPFIALDYLWAGLALRKSQHRSVKSA
jgi:predicted ATP-grasp superfamily ATP-dependent carboligase